MAENSLPIRLAPDQHANMRLSGSMAKKTAHLIDAEAAQWAARIDRGPLEPGQERAFQAWLNEDVRCMGAYARIRAFSLASERARALGPDFDPAAFAPQALMARRTALQLGGALAACALIAVSGTWAVVRNRGRFQTGKGETKVVALKDGSVVTLNTAPEIHGHYSDG